MAVMMVDTRTAPRGAVFGGRSGRGNRREREWALLQLGGKGDGGVEGSVGPPRRLGVRQGDQVRQTERGPRLRARSPDHDFS